MPHPRHPGGSGFRRSHAADRADLRDAHRAGLADRWGAAVIQVAGAAGGDGDAAASGFLCACDSGSRANAILLRVANRETGRATIDHIRRTVVPREVGQPSRQSRFPCALTQIYNFGGWRRSVAPCVLRAEGHTFKRRYRASDRPGVARPPLSLPCPVLLFGGATPFTCAPKYFNRLIRRGISLGIWFSG